MIIIWQICMREKDLFPSQRKEMADFYFILERYKVIDTKCWKDYEYTLDSRGEALYFKRIKREDRKSEIYDTAFQGEGMEFIPVPYRQGDILYIDCRPFLDPTYCLIYYVGDDACADHARIDGICKKDLMALCVKRC